MPFLKTLYECGQCGEVLDRKESSSFGSCSVCGCSNALPIDDIKETLVFKVKESGATGKPSIQVKIYDDFHRNTQEWRQVKMSINRQNDAYHKIVINPKTDEVIYENEEPLSKHRNSRLGTEDGGQKR